MSFNNYIEPEFKLVTIPLEDVLTASAVDFGTTNGFEDSGAPTPESGEWNMPQLGL